MGKWKDPSNPTTQEASESLGNWGQFDPFRVGDAAKFESLGGTEQQYRNMTPEERAHYKRMLTAGTPEFLPTNESNKAQKAQLQNWIRTAGGGQQAGPAGGVPPASDAELYAQLLGQTADASKFVTEQRLNPLWDRKEEQLQTRLLNQGLDPTSAASQNAMGQFGRDRNDAYASALNAAHDSAYRNALQTWMAKTNVDLGIGNQQRSDNADIAAAIAQASGPAAKALQEWLKTQGGGGGYTAPIGYDASGTPFYSSPDEWANPYEGY